MPWVRVDDQMPEHPKVERVGHLAAWLSVAALCYSNRNLTDGFIADNVMPRLTTIPQPKRHAKLLVEEGVWERVSGGYQIHDYFVYQKSAASIRKERAATAARQAKFRNNHSNGASNGVNNGHVAPSPHPHPTNTVVENSPPGLHEAERYEEGKPLTLEEVRKINEPARRRIRRTAP